MNAFSDLIFNSLTLSPLIFGSEDDSPIPPEYSHLFALDGAGNLQMAGQILEVTDWYDETVTIDDTAVVNTDFSYGDSAELFHLFDAFFPEASRADFQWMPNGDIRCLTVTEGAGKFEINNTTGALLVESFTEGVIF